MNSKRCNPQRRRTCEGHYEDGGTGNKDEEERKFDNVSP